MSFQAGAESLKYFEFVQHQRQLLLHPASKGGRPSAAAQRPLPMGGRGSKASAQGAQLVQAAIQKDKQAVEGLLAAGCPPDACDAEGNSALGAACYAGARDVVDVLLGAAADLEHRNAIGTTPLWCLRPRACVARAACAGVCAGVRRRDAASTRAHAGRARVRARAGWRAGTATRISWKSSSSARQTSTPPTTTATGERLPDPGRTACRSTQRPCVEVLAHADPSRAGGAPLTSARTHVQPAAGCVLARTQGRGAAAAPHCRC